MCSVQVVAGNRAGMGTILIDTTQSYSDQSSFEGELKPRHIVTSLAEIPELLKSQYRLERPAGLGAKNVKAPEASINL